MPNSTIPKQDIPEAQSANEATESFSDMLSQYEKSHVRKREDGSKQIQGTVITVSADSVYLDIGFKSEGVLLLADFQNAGQTPKHGERLAASAKARDREDYYQLTRAKVELPKDWSALEKAFAEKETI